MLPSFILCISYLLGRFVHSFCFIVSRHRRSLNFCYFYHIFCSHFLLVLFQVFRVFFISTLPFYTLFFSFPVSFLSIYTPIIHYCISFIFFVLPKKNLSFQLFWFFRYLCLPVVNFSLFPVYY